MNINRFTEKSQDVLREAQSIATRRSHQGVDVEHLLLAMLEQTDGLAPAIVQAAGANVPALKQRLNQELDRLPQVSGPTGAPEQIYVTPQLNRTLTRAEADDRQALGTIPGAVDKMGYQTDVARPDGMYRIRIYLPN